MATAPQASGFEPKLSADQIRRLQAFLNGNYKTELATDGVLGPATKRAALRVFRERPSGLEHNIMWSLQEAAFADPEGAGLPWWVPPVWIFYSASAAQEASWLPKLRPGDTIFWIHGRQPRSGAYKRWLRVGDTVLLLVGREFVASGVLLADDDLRFVDRQGRVRRPVMIGNVFSPRLPREELETRLDGPLIRQGAVHPFPLGGVDWLKEAQERTGATLPYGDPRAASLEIGAIHKALYAEEGWILPDDATARAIDWSQERWSEGLTPAPETSVPEPSEESEPEDGDAEDVGASNVDVQIPFVLDAPADVEDSLGRGTFALFLARRLHLIWCQINGESPESMPRRSSARPADPETFIAHVDSPWGGGKSTFANFVARVLDPRREILTERHFLRASLAATTPKEQLAQIPLEDVFVPPDAAQHPERWPGARRPWIIARYNAWRDQYVQPPWWQIFLTVHRSVTREIWGDFRAALITSEAEAASRFWAWCRAQAGRFAYQLWNTKLKAQAAVWLFTAALAFLIWRFNVVGHLLSLSGAATDPASAEAMNKWITVATAALGFGGASVATLFTVVSQSLSPDLDFTAEHKQIGVGDPIDRFRRAFQAIMEAARRPVLLIVDDLDRCDPKSVVEIMRGFQTIIRSPRLFVLLLGDRAWIEGAHDVYHKDLAAMGLQEGTLGSLYVQKVIQLSFRLPTIDPKDRREFARSVLGERRGEAAEHVTSVLRDFEAAAAQSVAEAGSVGQRERLLQAVQESAEQALPSGLSTEQKSAASAAMQQIAAAKLISAAGSDTAQQREVYNAIAQLVDCLPNNPRQIKRIFMAFATYEQVGRSLFSYRLQPIGGDDLSARRWRQLALWVTLAVEWPQTWRAVARRPEVLDAAYAKTDRAGKEQALLGELNEADQAATKALLRRLRTDPAVSTLLGGQDPRPGLAPDAQAFASIAVDEAAVYEFNRIIWEPGFPLEPNAAA